MQAFWAATSFLLTSIISHPNFVAISHLYGRCMLLFVALTISIIGFIACAISNNAIVMLVARAVQGVGTGGIIGLTEMLIADIVPLRERGKYFTLTSIVRTTSCLSSLLVGTVLPQVHLRGEIFYLKFLIMVIGCVGIIAYSNLEQRKRSPEENLLEINYIGSVIFLASTTMFLVAITCGHFMYSWSSWHTLLSIGLGLFGLALFAVHEAKYAKLVLPPFDVLQPGCRRTDRDNKPDTLQGLSDHNRQDDTYKQHPHDPSSDVHSGRDRAI
ncbi:hypothetical protein MMC18_008600 [Xylographa bjoerkii]|nr:hypothetical protein [Xylographa bjoerkii]